VHINFKFFTFLRFLLRNSHGTLIVSSVVGVIAGASGATLMALITSKLANTANSANSFQRFITLAIVALVASTISGLLSTYISQQTGFDMRMRMCRRILATPLRNVEAAGAHKILAALTQDTPAITGAFLRIPQLCTSAAVVIGCLIYLGWLSFSLLLALMVFLAIAIIGYVLPANKAMKYLRRGREEWDALIGHYRGLIEGAKELKLNRRRGEAFYWELVQGTTISLRRNNAIGGNIFVVLGSWTQMLYFLAIGLILFILPNIVGSLSTPVLTGYALTILYMAVPLMNIVGIIPTFNNAMISLEKVEQLGVNLSGSDTREVIPAPRLQFWRSLELIGVTHTYYRESDASSFVLGPLNLRIEPGELIFLIGGNGSGKTTLAKLLSGLYIPENGEIRLDGERIGAENRDVYRQFFSVVFSDFFLFEHLLGLKKTNLDERVKGYIEQLQLAHKVEVKGGKLSTTELSQGQRKRLALLTAYLEDRPCYIFDEWAADQDPVFRDIFYYQLLPELKAQGKTVLVISHDDRYYHIGDRIIKLDCGQLDCVAPVLPSFDSHLIHTGL